jgi:hypothetical protein
MQMVVGLSPVKRRIFANPLEVQPLPFRLVSHEIREGADLWLVVILRLSACCAANASLRAPPSADDPSDTSLRAPPSADGPSFPVSLVMACDTGFLTTRRPSLSPPTMPSSTCRAAHAFLCLPRCSPRRRPYTPGPNPSEWALRTGVWGTMCCSAACQTQRSLRRGRAR